MGQPDGHPQSEQRLLEQLLGDTRVRFRHHQTPFASAERLIDLDREIRSALLRPPSPEAEAEVHRLIERLRHLDPH